LDIGAIAAYSLLLRQVAEFGIVGGRTPKNEQEISHLFEIFQELLDWENELLKVKACQSKVLYLYQFDLDKLTPDQFSGFNIVETEKYSTFRRSLAIHDIYTPEEASKKIQQYNKERSAIGEINYKLLSNKNKKGVGSIPRDNACFTLVIKNVIFLKEKTPLVAG
jgi:hypothetical protein